MHATMGPCTVRIFDGLGPEGEEFELVKLTACGDDIKMYQWVEGSTFKEFDRFTECAVKESKMGMTVEGTSEKMKETFPYETDGWRVRLEVDFTGCPDCS